MRYCKLTNNNGRTFNNTQWGERVTHKVCYKGKALCSKSVT